MKHFVCKGGCGGVSEVEGFCEADGCPNQWQPFEECDCEDGKHFMEGNESADSKITVKDSNGNELKDGDSVVLIKDLPLRGSSAVYKRGTKVSNIKLTDNPEEIDCRIEGSAIVLRTEFLKKV
ncbi:MAG: zinc ribbon domain-containing protein YjdM [Candidatus Gracilibacteria bacterium]|nr:zinc ribbon domain-containing protein YjdM [Candidatus Gracilibacteria bacterium]